MSQKNPFYSILPEATLLSAVEEFAYGIHRGKSKCSFEKKHMITKFSKLNVIVCVLNPDGSIKVNKIVHKTIIHI